jgi:tetratricopeptide (TPR) repeat protein
VAYSGCWATSAHSGRTLEWLTLLGERMEGLDDDLAARLLVNRARLRARLGQIHGAFDDASRALTRAGGSADNTSRQEAVRLVERYGITRHDANGRLPGVNERGIDAGESLLRVAKLAVKHGEPQRALKLCAEAVVVLNYFGLVRGVLKAHQYRARIAYGMGDTALALQCITQCERTARGIGELHEVASADLMRANVLLADTQFGKAIELATAVLARPEISASPALLSRGLLVLGWAYYATGALPVLRAMSQGLIEQTRLSGEPGARTSAELLAMLVLARQGQQQTALRHIGPVLDLATRRPPVPDTQGDLVNAVDLVVHLGQPALALPLIDALQAFSTRPDHQLRPWTRERLGALQRTLGGPEANRRPPASAELKDDSTLENVLQKLMSD